MARKKLSEVQGGNVDYLGEGKHIVTIKSVEEVVSTKGNPMLNLVYENADGSICYDRVVLIEKALGFAKRLLSALGYDIDLIEYDVTSSGEIESFYYDDEDYGTTVLFEDYETEFEITIKEDNSPYKDPATGKMIERDKPAREVTSIKAIAE